MHKYSIKTICHELNIVIILQYFMSFYIGNSLIFMALQIYFMSFYIGNSLIFMSLQIYFYVTTNYMS